MRYPHLLSALFVLAAARPLSDPVPRWDNKSVKHAWHVVPAGWESSITPPAGVTIDLSIALKPHDENALIDALYEVSDPRHPKYGGYLSQDQVAELVAPHPHTFKLVNAWLEHHGVPSSSISTSHSGNWLTLTRVPLSKANDLLSASYQYFLHAETNETIIRTLAYALPDVLHPHVQTIVPTTFFGSGSPQVSLQTVQVHHSDVAAPHAKLLSSRVDDDDIDVTPSLLRTLYKMEAYVPSAVRKNILGTVGLRGLSASQADLSTFMAEHRPDAANANYVVVMVTGTEYDSNNPNVEMNIDVQYASAMSYPTPQLYFNLGKADNPTDDSFLTFLQFILDKPYIPQTITMTYFVVEQLVPPDYATTVCGLFAELAMRGASVLCPSGNSGVGRGDCMEYDKYGREQVQFRPTFPASCPYVTAVGGTTEFTPETETAAPLSGGGFSNIFERQPYQVTNDYIQNLGNQYAGFYNPHGRGLPDVSAQALYYVSITNGQPVLRSGTHCATPTMAGIISLLNDYQLSHNRPALGYLNPWLYGDGREGFRDITTGRNPGCLTNGFEATVGWDPVTGLGTPDFQKLVPLLPVPAPEPSD
ncbi:subtilisin-like protein [Lactarius quietus]|nr:subtilisin-like protein [Lactarius quietus]